MTAVAFLFCFYWSGLHYTPGTRTQWFTGAEGTPRRGLRFFLAKDMTLTIERVVLSRLHS